MKHYHYPKINSTQDEIEKLFNSSSNFSEILISADFQTNGRGRRDNIWQDLGNNIALSFSLKPNSIPTLTSIEIICLILKFFKQKFNIQLTAKWPNDLFNLENKKCGGIILKLVNEEILLVGIGLNIYHQNNSFGKIFDHTQEFHNKSLSLDIYQYINQNRITEKEKIFKFFNQSCLHNESQVKIIDGENVTQGIFIGIGAYGQALLKNSKGSIKEVFSGSLFF